MKFLLVLFLCLGAIHINAQSDHYLVELKKFSPPEEDVIRTLKEFPAEAFLAKDIAGDEYFLGDYKGKTIIIWFWSKNDPVSSSWLMTMNLLQVQYIDQLKIFGFANEDRASLKEVLQDNAVVFSNFPNGSVFGDIAYGGDLGLGRMFFIDKYGIIKEILPRSFFENNSMTEAAKVVETEIAKLIE